MLHFLACLLCALFLGTVVSGFHGIWIGLMVGLVFFLVSRKA